MTLSNIKELIEKRFQIKMTKNMNYQLLWHGSGERILVSYIRSDFKIIEIKKGLATLLTTFDNERELNQILDSFENIVGELNKKIKEKQNERN